MTNSLFKQVDVFTSQGFKGNPVAVVMNADGLTQESMQAIANWTNLSETTFILPATDPNADYRVRIFTPKSELPFAGHPTIGSAFALLESGVISPTDNRVIQECGAGLISLTVTDTDDGMLISFALPEPKFESLSPQDVGKLESLIGADFDPSCPPVLVDVGARWIVAKTDNAETVLGLKPDFSSLPDFDLKLNATGSCIFGSYAPNHTSDIEVRSFAPACGANEDPVCGSGNGAVAAFLRLYGTSGIFKSTQGVNVGRNGQIALSISDDQILVGGYAVTCIEGEIQI